MDPAKRYRQVQVTTSSQEDLLLLLLDGGVRFIEGALLEMEKEQEDAAKRCDLLIRAQKIVLELLGALSPSIGPEVYGNLQGLYRFILERLFAGNLKKDPVAVEEALGVFKDIRETWRAAVEKNRAEKIGPVDRPNTQSSVSWSG